MTKHLIQNAATTSSVSQQRAQQPQAGLLGISFSHMQPNNGHLQQQQSPFGPQHR